MKISMMLYIMCTVSLHKFHWDVNSDQNTDRTARRAAFTDWMKYAITDDDTKSVFCCL